VTLHAKNSISHWRTRNFCSFEKLGIADLANLVRFEKNSPGEAAQSGGAGRPPACSRVHGPDYCSTGISKMFAVGLGFCQPFALKLHCHPGNCVPPSPCMKASEDCLKVLL